MYTKKVAAVLLLITALAVTACGKAAGTGEDMTTGSFSEESPSDSTEDGSRSAEGTEDSEGENSQSAEEEEEAPVRISLSPR